MKCKLIIALAIIVSNAFSQNAIIDDRDGKHYEVFQVDNHLWFKTNLQYKSQTSWCNQHPESEACKSGNFYYSTDLINVCPNGWRVPSWMEYKKAIKFIDRNNNPSDSAIFSENFMPYKKYKILAEQVIGITLIGDSTFFDMVANGWIEGDKWEKQNETTVWVVEDISNSPQPHVHILKGEIIKHAHEHHVIDKEKKIRRFSVRCISDVK